MSDEAGSGSQGGTEGQAGERGWLSSIPENLREHEAFKGAASLKDVYTGYADLYGKSKESLAIPGDDATDEDRAAFYAKLGRPEAADKYQFTKPEGLIDESVYDPAADAAFKQLAFERGLSQKQAAELHGWYWSTVKAGQEQQRQATEKALDTLRGEWKGDAFQVNSERAVRAFKKFGGGDEAQAFLDKTVDGVALGNHPAFLKVFAKIGESISDDSMGGDRSHGTDAIASDEEVARRRFPNTKFK